MILLELEIKGELVHERRVMCEEALPVKIAELKQFYTLNERWDWEIFVTRPSKINQKKYFGNKK